MKCYKNVLLVTLFSSNVDPLRPMDIFALCGYIANFEHLFRTCLSLTRTLIWVSLYQFPSTHVNPLKKHVRQWAGNLLPHMARVQNKNIFSEFVLRFPLPLGVWEGLRFVILALP